MKNFAGYIAIAAVISLGRAASAEPLPVARCAPAPPVLAGEFQPGAPLTYPGFCDIPPIPTNIPTPQTFKTEVVGTRLAGAKLEGQTAPGTWSLTGTEDFESGAIREAAPPPPMNPPGGADTATFVAHAKAKATPPRRPR